MTRGAPSFTVLKDHCCLSESRRDPFRSVVLVRSLYALSRDRQRLTHRRSHADRYVECSYAYLKTVELSIQAKPASP